MSGPYRTAPPPVRGPVISTPHEEIVLAWALVVVGGVRVAGALVAGTVWGAQATIAMLLCVAGLRMLREVR
ncbi:MAG: hypothetical protein ACM31C_10665 [Acidobacteriota bacterium]